MLIAIIEYKVKQNIWIINFITEAARYVARVAEDKIDS